MHACARLAWAQVMEAREEVEETDDAGRLRALLETNRRAQAGLDARLAAAFHGNDLQGAAQLATKLTYLVRLEQEIVKKL